MTITFLGAAGTVTGSSYLLTTDKNEKILIDFGMFQGREEIVNLNREPLAFDPNSLTAVLLTHAHIDHCGRLPLLSKNGYKGPIYMTEATRLLSELTLLDSAKIAAENSTVPPLYTDDDVYNTLKLTKIVRYNDPFTLGSLQCIYHDAGHILGSASIECVTEESKKIIFSGDIGNFPEELVRPTELIPMGNVVVMESTYGDHAHSTEDSDAVLQQEINRVEKSGGTLLIPAFSLERSQVLLYKIDKLKRKNAVRHETPVYLDSPMAIKATEIYKQFKELHNVEYLTHEQYDDPLDFPGLTMIENIHQSREIKEVSGAKVIIAGSGMMSGGRIMSHAIQFLPIETTRLLIVGFQGEGTLGRQIIDGAKTVKIFDTEVQINATVRRLSSISAHADQPRLMSWLSYIQGVQQIFLTHGEDPNRGILAEKIKSDLEIDNVVLPKKGETIEVEL